MEPYRKVILFENLLKDPYENVLKVTNVKNITRPYGYRLTQITYEKNHGKLWQIAVGIAACFASFGFLLGDNFIANKIVDLWKKAICGKEIYVIKKEQMGYTRVAFNVMKKMGIHINEEQPIQNPAAFEKDSQKLSGINHSKTIPVRLYEDPVFANYKCAISGNPIRFALQSIYNQNVLYERSTIKQWISDHPNQTPPQWPQDRPFAINRLTSNGKVQMRIDERVGAYAKEFDFELSCRNTVPS